MAHKDGLLMEDELAAFIESGDGTAQLDDTLLEGFGEEPSSDSGWEEQTTATIEEAPSTAPSDETPEEEGPTELGVDVYETPSKVVIKARTAGISSGDLSVKVAENVVSISGVLSSGEDETDITYLIEECYWGAFERKIDFNTYHIIIDEDSVDASLLDGVLTISFAKILPKKEKEVPIRIGK